MPADLLPRHATQVAQRRLADARSIVVNGPRQAGKSELLRMLHGVSGGSLLTLDEPQLLRSARFDPSGFLADKARPLFIDEVQRGGDPLVLAIKVVLDSSREKGQIVLAGSTRFLTEPRLSESLAGRIRFVDLWTLSQGEIEQQNPEQFVDSIFRSSDEFRDSLRGHRSLSRREIFERLCIGGFPESVTASSGVARREFFSDYVRTISQRDITEMGSLAQRMDLPKTLRLLAERTAGILNRSKLADALGVPNDSVSRYLPLIETVFLTVELPAFAASTAARTRRRSKLHLTDSGLAAALLGVNADRLLDPNTTMSGPLLESFVVMELVKQLTWSVEHATMSHYRDDKDREIDIMLETPDGRIVAVEIKAAIDVDERDFRHVAHLRDRLGDRFLNGVVIHCGTSPASWGDRLTSVPVSALWHQPRP
jgi:uncharacterized protein